MAAESPSCPMPDRSRDDRIREILGTPCVVAVVGMSPKKDRPSNEVALYLRDHGFTIIPVHPKEEEIEGMKAYPDLESIPADAGVTIVDLFVAGPRTMPVVEQAGKIKAPIIWFQPGTENAESEARARELGMEVISGSCTKAEHQRLFG
jgi:predicted CoA-binding protein